MKKLPQWIEIDLILVLVFCITLGPLVWLTTGTPRAVFGILFVLLFPGYVLTSALFPRMTSLTGLERLALTLGLSLAVVALGGLGLNYTPWGINVYPVTVSLLAFVVAFTAVAWYRRQRMSPEERFALLNGLRLPSAGAGWNGQSPLSRVLTLGVVLSAVVALGMTGYLIAAPKPGESFTEFYILGSSGKADGYPKMMILGETTGVTVWIVNREFQRATYRLEVTADGQTIKTVDSIVLEDGQAHEQAVQWTAIRAGDHQEVGFLLYKGTDAQPYRSLRLWINVRGLRKG